MDKTMRLPGRKPRRRWGLLLLALVPLTFVFLFSYVPLLGWSLAFIDYQPGTPLFLNKWVGLKFFEIIIGSRDITRVMTNTIIFSGISILLLPLPMLFAVLLNEFPGKRFRKLAQTTTTLPYFISWVIVYSVCFSIFGLEGMFNTLLSALGLPSQNLLANAKAVYAFQTAIHIWKSLGWNAIIYIAAITSIDQELYEAATVDGAGRVRCALHITFPGLMPTFVVLMLLGMANFVNQPMEQYYVFQNAVVLRRIEVLDLYTYKMGLQKNDYSYATAVGILKSIVSLFLLFAVNASAKKWRGASIL